MRKRSKAFWIARDKAVNGKGDYVITPRKPHLNPNGMWLDATPFLETLSDRVFEAMTGMRLDPGAGPVRMRLVLDIPVKKEK